MPRGRIRHRTIDRLTTSITLVVLCALLIAPLARPASAQARPAAVVSAERFVQQVLEDGVDATNLLVDGDVVLPPGAQIDHLVRCIDCTIAGAFRAADVAFTRVVDLTGLHIRRSLDLSAATFADSFRLQSAAVDGSAGLALASFDRRVSLDGARFHALTARGASFASDLTAIRSTFRGSADFSSTAFGAISDFSQSTFGAPCEFSRAVFNGPASFQLGSFNDTASFSQAFFADTADFTSRSFGGPGLFDDATFRGTAAFRLVNSFGQLSFRRAKIAESVTFEAGSFTDGLALPVVDAERIVLDDAAIEGDSALVLAMDYTRNLRMDVDDAAHIAGTASSIQALSTLEATATLDGDLKVANDARYAALALSSRWHGPPGRLADLVLYRGLSGYLVRPHHPLLVLLAVLLLAAAVRAPNVYRSYGAPPPARAHRAAWAGVAVAHAFARSAPRVSTAWRRSDGASRGEAWVYGLLIALALIAIGNSNPTFRQVLDAIR